MREWSQLVKSKVFLAAAVALVAIGCTTISVLPQHGEVRTILDRANYRVIKANVRGEDTGFALLGFIPIISPSVADATDRVMEQVDSEGRAIALVNVAQQRNVLYLILFSLTRVEVRADIIEFTENAPPQQPNP